MLVSAAIVVGILSTVLATSTTEQDLIAALNAGGLDVSRHFNTALLTSSTPGSPSGSCSHLCAALPAIFPGRVLSNGSAADFWSQQQAEVRPACIFRPADSHQVSRGLLLARLTKCPFAVKSGGHAAFAGASNIQDGLTIDLSALNSITLSSNGSIAHIGAGNRWLDVYTALQPYNLSVIGGRVSDIGVGGLTLGGGISFFSGIYGWACDNVANYEVVTANGAVLEVNLDSYPDLYWALRGGGNNFGIVTRFDLTTHPQGLMWGGSRLYPIEYKTDLVNALVQFGEDALKDPNAALIVSFAYAQGTFLVNVDIEYAKPVVSPPIFSSFEAIPAVQDTMGIKSLPEITLEFKQSNPDGLRESYWAATFKLDTELVTFIVDTFMTELRAVENATGLIPAVVLQVITTDMTTHMSKNGGNALGLDSSEGPLLLLNLSFMWANAADDDAIMAVLGSITAKSITEAKSRGLYHEYLYMNYASQYQDVVQSYGATNHERLQTVARKYDPDQVFQKLQPGYFKLNKAPNSTYPSSK